jgi:tricorn protease
MMTGFCCPQIVTTGQLRLRRVSLPAKDPFMLLSKLLRTLLFFAICTLAVAAGAADVFMPRYPAISPDGQTVVFSFQGDLWRVPSDGGTAMRLTAHEAYDAHAVFSPDGRQLAFASNRFGDDDIFIMPAEGGAPRRLTHASSTDTPGAFSPDGRTLYFAARREFDFPMSIQIQTVPVSGGTPMRLADFFGDEVAVTADGDFIIAQGRVKPQRMRYRGSYQREIYFYREGGDPVRLTENRGYDTYPMSGPDGRVYWLSDQDKHKTANVWSMTPDGLDKTQLTKFKGDGVRAAAISRETGRVVMEQGTSLWLMDPGGKPREMKIQVAADVIENPVVIQNKTADADELAVSDDGEELALVIEGEIVLVNKELGGRATVPISGAFLEQSVNFRPGGADTLLFVTDSYGENTICLLVSDDEEQPNLRLSRKHRIIKLTSGKKPASNPLWSPDGRRIVWTSGNADLHVMDADGGNDKTLFEHWGLEGYCWSPDGRWLAFSRLDRNYNSDIWIMPSDGGDQINVTRHPDYDEFPVWSPDGRMLAWATSRHSKAPLTGEYDAYFLYLTREDHERTEEQWKIWEKTRDKVKEKAKTDEDGDEDDETEEATDELVVTIDFEDIHLRGRRVSDLEGFERVVGIDPKGDKLYFTGTLDGDDDLFSVNRFGKERENVTSGGVDPRAVSLDAEGKTFHYLKSGKPNSIAASGGKAESVDFRARLVIDRPAIRLQLLDEGWRIMRDRFYDPDMHGVDWPAMRKKYGDWVQKAGHDVDFGDIVNLMLGELNASHMGYRPNWESPGNYGSDGHLGLDFDRSHRGDGLKISYVLPNGPCDRIANRLLVGDVLLAVDGQPVSRSENLFRTLENQADLPVWLTVERDGDELEFEVVPQTFRVVYTLHHRATEKEKRGITEAATDGRVGYVHIQGMGFSEVARFQHNLFAAADGREALIIDVRNNGGGWTTDLLLSILTQPVHAYTIGRNGEIGYPQTERQPFFRWSKPIAVICNEGSYSNAEIFSLAIQTIGRGPVVGMETGGNVISTGGFGNRYRGYIRLPGRGWYVWGDEAHPERNNKPQEGVHDLPGCIPDYIVPLTLSDRLHDRDPQLQKAVDLMLEAADLEKTKPQRGEK